MPQETKTVSAKLDASSTLAAEFEEYREANGMTSKSEAVRHLLRAGLEQEQSPQADDDTPDSTASGQSSGQSATDPDISINLLSGNEALLFALAFIIGSDGILTATQSVAGQFWGSVLYSVGGIVIIASLLPLFLRSLSELVNGIAADADDADANAGGVRG